MLHESFPTLPDWLTTPRRTDASRSQATIRDLVKEAHPPSGLSRFHPVLDTGVAEALGLAAGHGCSYTPAELDTDTTLSFLVKLNRPDAIRTALRAGIDPLAPSRDAVQPLQLAAGRGYGEAALLILNALPVHSPYTGGFASETIRSAAAEAKLQKQPVLATLLADSGLVGDARKLIAAVDTELDRVAQAVGGDAALQRHLVLLDVAQGSAPNLIGFPIRVRGPAPLQLAAYLGAKMAALGPDEVHIRPAPDERGALVTVPPDALRTHAKEWAAVVVAATGTAGPGETLASRVVAASQ